MPPSALRAFRSICIDKIHLSLLTYTTASLKFISHGIPRRKTAPLQRRVDTAVRRVLWLRRRRVRPVEARECSAPTPPPPARPARRIKVNTQTCRALLPYRFIAKFTCSMHLKRFSNFVPRCDNGKRSRCESLLTDAKIGLFSTRPHILNKSYGNRDGLRCMCVTPRVATPNGRRGAIRRSPTDVQSRPFFDMNAHYMDVM
ncbi:hypothetical protein EVAR_95156_1 [Eumeta japonica]|uniref:Uncharacterized protein n=1 Tax=Eumeta variegata TaxID=151549 RepID=A0A4C1VHS4_EUMVA|nr:hypothetical protein EVAR_95156_1 [Eumeta japonica]